MNSIYICCKQSDCKNAGALYFISQEDAWLKKIACPLCGETMEVANVSEPPKQ